MGGYLVFSKVSMLKKMPVLKEMDILLVPCYLFVQGIFESPYVFSRYEIGESPLRSSPGSPLDAKKPGTLSLRSDGVLHGRIFGTWGQKGD